jgi:Flp pilus assembly pilin Flp
MGNLIRKFWEDESGPEMVEWAVVTIVLLVATMPVLLLLRNAIFESLQSVFKFLEEDPKDAYIP